MTPWKCYRQLNEFINANSLSGNQTFYCQSHFTVSVCFSASWVREVFVMKLHAHTKRTKWECIWTARCCVSPPDRKCWNCVARPNGQVKSDLPELSSSTWQNLCSWSQIYWEQFWALHISLPFYWNYLKLKPIKIKSKMRSNSFAGIESRDSNG